MKTYSRVCEFCGEAFESSRPWTKRCKKIECQRQAWRITVKHWRDKDPARARAYFKAWREHNPDLVKAAQTRYNTVTCTSCGKVNHTHTKLAKRADYVCRQCKVEQRLVSTTCHLCGLALQRVKSLTFEKSYCQSCVGAYTRAGLHLSLTRERVRQLVNREYAAGGMTRLEALEQVMSRRLKVAP